MSARLVSSLFPIAIKSHVQFLEVATVMSSSRSLIAILMLGSLLAGGCRAASVSTRYYDISGNSADQLANEVVAKGPRPENKWSVASTDIRFVRSVARLDRQGSSCRFKDVRYHVEIKFTAPRWVNKSDNDDAVLRSKWKRFSDHLKSHRSTRVKIAENFARQLERGFLSIPRQPSCTALVLRAKKLGERILMRHDKAQDSFTRKEGKWLARFVKEEIR